TLYPAMLRGRLSSALLAAMLVWGAAGCGLSHYQQQMAIEQARVEGLEAEPLQLPEKKGRPPVFFRPPQGINSIGVPLEGGMLYRHSVHPRATSLFADVALAAEAMKDDEFWSALLRSFPGKERKDFQPLKEGETGRLAFTELKSEDSKYASF